MQILKSFQHFREILIACAMSIVGSLFFTTLLLAEEPTPDVSQENSTVMESDGFTAGNIFSERDLLLRDTFKDAVSAFKKKDLDKASIQFGLLRGFIADFSYRGAPDFSFDLIRLASDSKYSLTEQQYLLFQAESLSSEHPGVLLALSTLPQVLGIGVAFGKAWMGLNLLAHHPISLGSIMGRMMVVLIFAFTVVIFSLSILYLIGYSGELFYSLSKLFPRSIRGFGAVCLFSLVLFLPLTLPLLVAVTCWVICLVIFLPRTKLLSYSLAFNVALLTIALPATLDLITVTESPVSSTLERASNQWFTPRTLEIIERVKQNDSSNPLFHLLLGQLLHQGGSSSKAREHYRVVEEGGYKDKSLAYLIQLNLGVIEYSRGNFTAAHERWMKLYNEGWKEFSLYYNLSISAVDVFDNTLSAKLITDLHTNFEYDLNRVSSAQGERPVPVLAALPASMIFGIITRKFETGTSTTKADLAKSSVGREILGNLSPIFYNILCVLLVVLGIARNKSGSQRYRGSLVTRRVFLSLRSGRFSNKCIPGLSKYFNEKKFTLLAFLVIIVTIILLIINYPINIFQYQSEGLLLLIPLLCLFLVLGVLGVTKGEITVVASGDKEQV